MASSKTNSKPKVHRYSYSVEQKVAWGDMDAQQHVNNVSYLRYFETARAEFMLKLRTENTMAPPRDRAAVISHVEMSYRGQVFYPDRLEVTLGLTQLGSRTFSLGCTMWNSKDHCVAHGHSVHMWVDSKTGRPVRMPDDFRSVAESVLEQP